VVHDGKEGAGGARSIVAEGLSVGFYLRIPARQDFRENSRVLQVVNHPQVRGQEWGMMSHCVGVMWCLF